MNTDFTNSDFTHFEKSSLSLQSLFSKQIFMLRPVLPVLVILTQLSSGCVTTTTLEGERLRIGSSQFRDHALSVFKAQNSTLTELFDVLETADDEDATRIDDAELRMIEACETLNSAAAAQRDGKKLSLRILSNIYSDIRSCDEATQAANQLIRELSPAPSIN